MSSFFSSDSMLYASTLIFIVLHTQAAICLHQKISQNFFPTAIRFHYIFNLRDLTNIFQVTYKVSVIFSFGIKNLLGVSRCGGYPVCLA